MKSILLHFFVFIFIFFFNCSASKNLSEDHRLKHDYYSYLIHSITSTTKNNFPPNNKFASSKINKIRNDTSFSTRQLKKWQVGRVSRKQYEVINMICRKTKIFVDIEDTTVAYKHLTEKVTKVISEHEFPVNSIPHPILQSTTPSFIEFYYLDEIDERIKRKDSVTPQTQKLVEKIKNNRFVLPNGPIFAFHINDPYYKWAPVTQPTNDRRKKFQIRRLPLLDLRDYVNFHVMPTNKIENNNKYSSLITPTNILNKSKNSDVTLINIKTEPLSFNKTNSKESNNYTYYLSTPYDKVKFFELYDKYTRIPYNNKNQLKNGEIYYEDSDENEISHTDQTKLLKDSDEIEISHTDQTKLLKDSDENEISHTDKIILLKDVDQNSHHDDKPNRKFVKKHIVENFADQSSEKNDHKMFNKNPSPLIYTCKNPKNITAAKKYISNLAITVKAPQMYQNESKSVLWSEYPFAAVYIHESAQVHCDAAGISAHWLVAAGSCLSRHQKNPAGQGRSAFVAYCGDSWWQPKRVAYVKYSLVHPRFHPRERNRRHLYNIGLIQVVSSMASACAGWAPITLMSHPFTAEQDGSTSYALGWGLDRFDVQYSSPDLPKWPLKVYKGLIFSDSCPGSIGYSKVRRSVGGGMKNVYCLALPPYNGEKNDPVHGGLLLIGEHLIGLYLQEERRPWGEQSAQYTGTWRLTSWILDMAREPDEGESFTVEI